MARRALLLFLAAGFGFIAQGFLAVGLYCLLEPRLHPPLAALVTALVALALTGMLATIALWRRRQPAPVLGASVLGFNTLTAVTRFAERHPMATLAAAAGAGLLQAVLSSRRR